MSRRQLIAVTDHCLERLAKRAPEVKFPDRTTVRLEVAVALREQRFAANPPAWLGRKRERSPAPGVVRFAWEPSRSRCYVIKRERSHDQGRHVWTVLTVLVPEDSADGPGRSPRQALPYSGRSRWLRCAS